MLKKLIANLDGWKSIIGYLLAQILGDFPLVLTAIQSWLANPSDKQALANVIAQVVLAFGLSMRLIKNLTKRT